MANPSRYRFIDFTGGEILQSRELQLLQRIQEGLDAGGTNHVAFDLNMLYREGATFNILPSISSWSVTLAPINTSLPMYVFVRGQWEILQSSEVGAMVLPSSGGNIYLNWALREVNSTEDPTLVDTSTGEPTAPMGELDLAVSITDTSAVALGGSQFEKNILPIILFYYNSSALVVPIDNVNSLAWGGLGIAGFVSLSTNTANGIACATDDPRLSSTRPPTAGTVVDASVRIPSPPGGTNTDGTPIYNLSSDPGGINASKIVYVAGSQLVSDAIGWIKGQISSILGTLTSHIGVQLGSSATHPMPTAAQVGAAPASHVGLPLGLGTSHPYPTAAQIGALTLSSFTNEYTTNGYVILPGGLILQWMKGATTLNNVRQNFTERWTLPFPNACFNVQVALVFDNSVSTDWQGVSVYIMPGNNKTSVAMFADQASAQNVESTYKVFLFGIGY
jgi:hypothetical protein